jgi:hypothetical protein
MISKSWWIIIIRFSEEKRAVEAALAKFRADKISIEINYLNRSDSPAAL